MIVLCGDNMLRPYRPYTHYDYTIRHKYIQISMQNALLETKSIRLSQEFGLSSYKGLIFTSEVATSFGWIVISLSQMHVAKKNTLQLEACDVCNISHWSLSFWSVPPCHGENFFPQQLANPLTFLCWRCPEKAIKSGLHQEVRSGRRQKILWPWMKYTGNEMGMLSLVSCSRVMVIVVVLLDIAIIRNGWIALFAYNYLLHTMMSDVFLDCPDSIGGSSASRL